MRLPFVVGHGDQVLSQAGPGAFAGGGAALVVGADQVLAANVCGGSAEVYEWFMDWLADMFQNPHIKRPSAVIMVGVPGCGKSKVGE